MKMYIPRLGDVLWLTKPWTFSLFNELRNKTLFQALKLHIGMTARGYSATSVTLQNRTALSVDRIYIRRGQREFDSVSFLVNDLDGTGFIKTKKPRFWAKLDDVNNMRFTSVTPVTLRDPKTQPQTDVHTEHCCSKHGCKYGYDRHPVADGQVCTVASGQLAQSYECEDCGYDADED